MNKQNDENIVSLKDCIKCDFHKGIHRRLRHAGCGYKIKPKIMHYRLIFDGLTKVDCPKPIKELSG